MVPWRRFELPQDCSYTPLKRARLPISPPRQRKMAERVYQRITSEKVDWKPCISS